MEVSHAQVDAHERDAIAAEGCGIHIETAPYAVPPPDHEVHGESNGMLACETAIVRRFLGIDENEAIELTAFSGKWPWVAQCRGVEDHIRLLETVERTVPKFTGAYLLCNGPMDPAICARYPQSKWLKADNGRAGDSQMATRRSVFIDIDPVRPKGISATNEERRQAWEAASKVRVFLEEKLGKNCVGFGGSGNGYFLLIAVDPIPTDSEQTAKISRFLKALQRGFGNDVVSIDDSVVNPARLFAAPGTWKRKGQNTPDRPHRETSFVAPMNIERVPLVEVAG